MRLEEGSWEMEDIAFPISDFCLLFIIFLLD
jgi:hypothetical protein